MHNPNFSSGPCSKRPIGVLIFSRTRRRQSHRSSLGKEKLAKAIAESREILGIPKDYLVGIMPGSDTGVSKRPYGPLGARPVTVMVWESFSEGWATDITKHFETEPTILKADYGRIPDLTSVNWSTDVVFVANGTTSGYESPTELDPKDRRVYPSATQPALSRNEY